MSPLRRHIYSHTIRVRRLSFFKPLLEQDACAFSLVERVVERRRRWAKIRKEYAYKHPNMNMKLPKVRRRVVTTTMTNNPPKFLQS